MKKELLELKKEFIIEPTKETIMKDIKIMVDKGIRIVVDFKYRKLMNVLLPDGLKNKDYWEGKAKSIFILLKEFNMLNNSKKTRR